MYRLLSIAALLFLIPWILGFVSPGDWGFFGHRLINQMAVYTLPPEMMHLYKPNLSFIKEHAVDPDKRRYASLFEASRHYMDLDRWGEHPYADLPRKWSEALIKYTDIVWYQSDADSLIFSGRDTWQYLYLQDTSNLPSLYGENIREDFSQFFVRSILPHYYDDEWEVDCEVWNSYLELADTAPCLQVRVIDSLSSHGILPYHLIRMQRELTRAFVDLDQSEIIRLSAEMGHYIGDAHVPLHTTRNYNGQLTDQLGIHAFWESRIPELFAEEEYDFFVGKADYIDDPETYYWDIVLESNALVDSVLLIEKSLSKHFPSDQQYCFDDRLDVTIRIQCEAYARAYQDRMQGMVEDRMRHSIQAIGSSWYTAWVDAGQPSFDKTKNPIGVEVVAEDKPIHQIKSRRLSLRKHE
jgi:hypothetical protein